MIRIALDFDNTIVDYKPIFKKLGKDLFGSEFNSKNEIKNAVIENGSEADWTLLQGKIYGELMNEFAVPYPNVCERLAYLAAYFDFEIVSHRSRFPFLGVNIDLHRSACDWIRQNLPLRDVGITRATFCERKIDKILLMSQFDGAVDDLPEILESLPQHGKNSLFIKILFDPESNGSCEMNPSVGSWNEVSDYLLKFVRGIDAGA